MEPLKRKLSESLINKTTLGNRSYLDKLWTTLFQPGEYTKLVEALKKLPLSKGVCGKALSKKDLGWFCQDCQRDAFAIICQDCFEQGNHTGHQCFLSRYVSGCCDCGDPTAINPKGFCIDHQGFIEESVASMDLLPPEFRETIPKVINLLCLRLYSVCKELHESESNEAVEDEELDKLCEEIEAILNSIRQISELSPIFMYAISKELVRKQSYYYTNNEWESEEAIDNLPKINELDPAKQGNLLDEIINVHHLFPRDLKKNVVNFFVYHLQSQHFRKESMEIYMSNLLHIYKHVVAGRGKLKGFGMQILNSDENCAELFSNPKYIHIILDTLHEILTNTEEQQEEDDEEDYEHYGPYDKLGLFKNELKFCMKTRTTGVIAKSDFFQKYFEILREVFPAKRMQMLEMHLEDEEIEIPIEYSKEAHLIKMFKMVAKGINYTDHEYCRWLGKIFKEELLKTSNKLNQIKESYFSIPLHRIFLLFLTSYLNVTLFTSTIPENIDSTKIREFLKQTLDLKTDIEFDEFTKIILKPVFKNIGFFLEVQANKWIYYGDELNEIAENYVVTIGQLDAALIQLFLSCLTDSKNLIGYIVDSISQDDKWLKSYYETIAKIPKLSQDDVAIQLSQMDIDLDKAKRILENTLCLLCGLCTNDCMIISPIWRTLFSKQVKMEYLKDFQTVLKPYKNYAMRKSVIHAFFQKKKLWVRVGKLKSILPKSFSNDAELIECLKIIADKGKDKVKGSDVYCLKQAFLREYNPFYYIFTGQNADGYEKSEEIYKKNKDPNVFNPVFGPDKLPAGLPVNFAKHFTNVIKNTELMEYLKPILTGHRESISDFQILCSLKLIQITQNPDLHKEPEEHKMPADLHEAILAGINQIKPAMSQYAEIFEQYQKNLLESKSLTGEASKVNLTKKRMQEKILEEFKKRSVQFASKNKEILQELPKPVPMEIEEQKISTNPICVICKETLNETNFVNKPYGQLFFTNSSNVYYHYLKQGIQTSFRDDENMRKIPGYTMGMCALSCGHYLHYCCAADLLKKTGNKRLCPLCKTLFTTLLPNKESIQKISLKDKESQTMQIVRDFFETFTSFYNNEIESISMSIGESPTTDEQLKIVSYLISYNSCLTDCTDFKQTFLKKAELFHSLYHLCRFSILEELDNNTPENIIKQSEFMLQSLLSDEFGPKNILFIEKPILLSWTYMFMILKIQENCIDPITLRQMVSDYTTFCIQNLCYQVLLKELFIENFQEINLAKFKEIFSSSSYLQTFIPLSKNILKQRMLPTLMKMILIKYVMQNEISDIFKEESIQNLERLNDLKIPIEMRFKMACEFLNCEQILNWFIDPFYEFSYPTNKTLNSIIPFSNLSSKIINLYNPETESEQQNVFSVNMTKLAYTFDFLQLYQPHQFLFYNLTPRFTELEQIHYKRKCKTCGKQKRHNALCLLCGDILCVSSKCCMVDEERELSRHTRICGSGKCFFLYFAMNMLIVIYNGKATKLPSIYVNQHGESVEHSEEGLFLSPSAVQNLINIYTQDKIPQTVIYQRKVKEIYIDVDV